MTLRLPPALVAAGDALVRLDIVDSTMAEAARRFAAGSDDRRLWIVADEQTSGRGRRGRAWSSPPGNLHLTLLLPTATPPRDQPKLGFAVGAALARTARALLPPDASATLKWPNDLLVGGAKASGLLLEGLGGGAAVAIGVGVNIVAHPPDTPYPATHLRAHAPDLTRETFFAALAEALVAEIADFAEGRGFALTRPRWLAHAAHVGERIAVRQDRGVPEGRFEGIDDEGRLVLRTDAGMQRIAAGDVFPLDK
jgi:BirA family biotin operon repressor/biotin-[acetyl-CoA-carboxylase] ligase